MFCRVNFFPSGDCTGTIFFYFKPYNEINFNSLDNYMIYLESLLN